MQHVIIELTFDFRTKKLASDMPVDLMYHFKRSKDIKLHYVVENFELNWFGGKGGLRKYLISEMLQNNGEVFGIELVESYLHGQHLDELRAAGITKDNCLLVVPCSSPYSEFDIGGPEDVTS